MSAEARYVRVGSFVLLGIALALGVVLFLGSGALFEHSVMVETCFDESVQGLDVGSPVKLRGVKIGTVSTIDFVGDHYSFEDDAQRLLMANWVLVRMKIEDPDRSQSTSALEESIKALVEQGMRLQLTPLGITGTSFVQANFLDPAKFPPLAIPWKPEEIYVPSAPSTITQISSAAERLLARIDKLDVERLLTNFDTLLVNVNRSVGEADVAKVRESTDALLGELRGATEDLRRALAAADPGGVSRDLRRALDEATATLSQMSRTIDRNSGDLAATLDNLRAVSENLRDVSETARLYPSYLIFGRPPSDPAAEEKK